MLPGIKEDDTAEFAKFNPKFRRNDLLSSRKFY